MAAVQNTKGKAWRRGKLKYTPSEILDKYSDYINYCDDTGFKPTWEGFAGYVDLTSATLFVWLNAKNEDDSATNPEMAEALLKVQDSIVNRLLQRTDSMASFLIKQPKYGGYNDKPSGSGGEAVRVEFNIRGIGDGADSK